QQRQRVHVDRDRPVAVGLLQGGAHQAVGTLLGPLLRGTFRMIMASVCNPRPAALRPPGTCALAPAPRSAGCAQDRGAPTRAASATGGSGLRPCAAPYDFPPPPEARATVRCSFPAGPRSARSPPPDPRSC